jgi:circularin A/uberolysin family circular bacteriocin
MSKKKGLLVVLSLVVIFATGSFVGVNLATMLGITTKAASKIINVIDAVSTVAMIISLVTAIVGAGVVTEVIVATAKKMVKKYGKKYAAAW